MGVFSLGISILVDQYHLGLCLRHVSWANRHFEYQCQMPLQKHPWSHDLLMSYISSRDYTAIYCQDRCGTRLSSNLAGRRRFYLSILPIVQPWHLALDAKPLWYTHGSQWNGRVHDQSFRYPSLLIIVISTWDVHHPGCGTNQWNCLCATVGTGWDIWCYALFLVQPWTYICIYTYQRQLPLCQQPWNGYSSNSKYPWGAVHGHVLEYGSDVITGMGGTPWSPRAIANTLLLQYR